MDWALFQILNHFIPTAYMPIIVIILVAFLTFEQYLASTNRIKANSTLQLIVGFVQYFLGKEKGNVPTILRPEQSAPSASGSQRGPEVTGGGTTIENSGTAEGKSNEYIPDWVKGTGGLGGPSGK
jgi:hypothetical protein